MSDQSFAANLDDLLNLDQAAQAEQPRTPPPAAPRVSDGGYGPLIEAKRKEIIELEKRIETHRQTGVYMKPDPSGRGEYFDGVGLQEDASKQVRLNRELSDLQRKQDDHLRLTEARSSVAKEMARTVFQREVAKLPEATRQKVAEEFVRIYGGIPAGEWVKSVYANRETLEAAIMQIIHTAVGRVSFSTWQGAPPTGLEGQPPAEPQKGPDDDMDDFTNNVLYAFERRQKGSRTIAQQRAENPEAWRGKP